MDGIRSSAGALKPSSMQSIQNFSLKREEEEDNKQEQEYEIEALQSIYPDEFFDIDRAEDLMRAFTISVHVEVASTLHLTADVATPAASPASETAPATKPAPIASWSLSYLPPLNLCCVLPPSYPSKSPPHFTLSCLWLNVRQLSLLCRELDSLARTSSEQVVIFLWVDFLARNSLPFLGIESTLSLHPPKTHTPPPDEPAELDPRAISGLGSVEADLRALVRFNEGRKQSVFLQEIHTCSICLSDHPGTEFVNLPCSHHFCRTCLTTFGACHVAEGAVGKLLCPTPTCQYRLPPGVLKELLSSEEFRRWEDLTLQRTLDAMEDLVYCPRCTHPCLEEADSSSQCALCFFSFCSLCRGQRHVGQQCMGPEARLRVLQARREGREAGVEQRRKEEDLVNELRSLEVVHESTVPCPKCKMAIERTEGCNKMTCSQCHQYFCYRCGKAIDGYLHYEESSCSLYEVEEIARMQAEQDGAQPLDQQPWWLLPAGGGGGVQEERGGFEFKRCPRCGQGNAKEGNNNHVTCWVCRNHFCFLCGQEVRSSAQHFGANKCLQHTR